MVARLAYLVYLWLYFACVLVAYALAFVGILYCGFAVLSWFLFGA